MSDARCLRGAMPLSLSDRDQIELEEFLALWGEYGITRAHLSLICDCSDSTVNHWFSEGRTHKEPTARHKRLLADAHYNFCWLLTLPIRYQEIYSELTLPAPKIPLYETPAPMLAE